MIDIKYVKCPYVISYFDKHLEVKDKVLDIINSQSFPYGEISNTDWHLNGNIPRKYADVVNIDLTNHMSKIFNALNFQQFYIVNYWYQQYKTNSDHPWHVHGSCNFTNVYYLELPSGEVATNFIDPENNSVIVPNVHEGCILTIPSFLQHCSPKNKTDKTKTVIAFNINTP